ncbi:hypothetical protein SUGI_0464140 [Cryptomeria japonica]|nr:hypothetical protein SUGI_0464140 [Cryptomeria japonica]
MLRLEYESERGYIGLEYYGRTSGKIVLLGVDDVDIFKGISLKLLVMEQLLNEHEDLVGKVVLVQIVNPAHGRAAVPDGMNLIPYKYIVCRQGTSHLDASFVFPPNTPKRSMLVVSEIICCSPSLSGAIRVNPWNIEALAEAMNIVITMPDIEKQMRHEKQFRYVISRGVTFWD